MSMSVRDLSCGKECQTEMDQGDENGCQSDLLLVSSHLAGRNYNAYKTSEIVDTLFRC
jgi:hypothetical protein